MDAPLHNAFQHKNLIIQKKKSNYKNAFYGCALECDDASHKFCGHVFLSLTREFLFFVHILFLSPDSLNSTLHVE